MTGIDQVLVVRMGRIVLMLLLLLLLKQLLVVIVIGQRDG